MFRRLLLLLLLSLSTFAQQPTLSKTVQACVWVESPKVILTHMRIIDSTGASADDDQNIVIESGKLNVTLLDLRGYTVMPGIVGLHNHLYYIARPDIDAQRHFESPVVLPQLTFSAPRLYLAGGVTTLTRTYSTSALAD
jgi:imidazolonepropionase-like amidohydrolase